MNTTKKIAAVGTAVAAVATLGGLTLAAQAAPDTAQPTTQTVRLDQSDHTMPGQQTQQAPQVQDHGRTDPQQQMAQHADEHAGDGEQCDHGKQAEHQAEHASGTEDMPPQGSQAQGEHPMGE